MTHTIKAAPVLFLSVTLILTSAPTRAAMPVIDVRAIAQMASQLRTLQNQLTTARDQLTQARSQLAALTGDRGARALLAGHPALPLPGGELDGDT